MTDSQLDKLLKSAPAPERPADYWEEFPTRVQSRLHESSTRVARPHQSRNFRLAWGSAIAALCLIVGYVAGQWHGATQKSDSYALLQNEKAVGEILTMFPNRVRAIVQTEKGVQLVLSDKADVPTSPPLWIKVGEGKAEQAAVTFSGQEIQIGGEKMTVLADAKGGIILMADRLIWSSTATNRSLKIQARELRSVTF